jgi:uncharacterized protein YcfL
MNKYLIMFVALFMLTACDSRLSNEELANQVIVSMEESPIFVDGSISVDSLMITRNSAESYTYTGVLETSEPGGSFTYSVVVTYDGKTFTWEVLE